GRVRTRQGRQKGIVRPGQGKRHRTGVNTINAINQLAERLAFKPGIMAARDRMIRVPGIDYPLKTEYHVFGIKVPCGCESCGLLKTHIFSEAERVFKPVLTDTPTAGKCRLWQVADRIKLE